ncbi:MAG: hypothetical protein R3B47_16300 [Bacteroidia bacterium]
MGIATAARITPKQEDIRSILILGNGRLCFRRRNRKSYISETCKVLLFFIGRDYRVPAWVGPHSLVIASSYSGNTEETLASLEHAMGKGAEICAITFGRKAS